MSGYAIDRDALNHTLGLFSQTLKIRATFFDRDHRELGDLDIADRSPYCALLRQNPEMDAQCRECDRQHIGAAQEIGRAHIYRCHRGLWEAVLPLFNNRQHYIGAVLCGQLRATGPARKRHIDNEHREAYQQLPQVGATQFQRIVDLLSFVCQYIIDREVIRAQEPDWTETIERFIDNHLAEPLPVERLATAIGRSQSFVAHQFKKVFHTTPLRYITNKRMDAACECLKKGRSLQETAQATGYYDVFHFSKTFHKYRGEPPSVFQKKNLGTHEQK